MERHGHLHLAPEVRAFLLAMSAATIDRALRGLRDQAGSRARRRVAASSAVRRSIPVRTFSDWQDPPPGYVEADLVAHSGPSASGSFVQTLVLTDIATGWTECAPLLVREQVLLKNVLGELRKLMPFDLLGFDTDNDSVFINETIRDYCQAEGIAFTRCRPYRKNDQAFVEQKNGAVVRRIVGYRRLEGLAAAAVLARLYATTRLFVNVFQPSFKLAGKEREGARVRKRYHPPATPCERLLADPRRSAARELGSGWLAGRNEGGAASARRHRRSRHRGAHHGRRTVDRGVPGGASHGLEGGGGQANGATQAEAEGWPAPAGPAHRGDDGVAGLVRRRSVANGTRVARAAAGRTSGALPRSAAANPPASAEGLAGRDGPDPRVRHRGAARARADAVDGHCAGMIVGNIGVRQRAVSSGAFLHEAIRTLIQIVALHPSDGGLWTSRKVAAWMAGELGLAAVLPQRGWEALKAINWSVQKPPPRHPAGATP